MRTSRFLIGLAALCVPTLLWAMPPKRITAAEKALLPPYCRYTQGGYVGHENPQQPSPGAQRWVNTFGGEGMTANLWRMHHYCYALIHMMRGQRHNATAMERKEAWLGAVEEIDFTLEFLPRDFILMPEMLLNRGRALMRLRKVDAALSTFEQAIELKQDYWPPYLEIADIHVRRKDTAKAVEVLEEGLRHAPEAQALKTRLAELGKRPSKNAGGPAAVEAPATSSERP